VGDPAPELRREKMNELTQESQERKLEMHSFLQKEEKKKEEVLGREGRGLVDLEEVRLSDFK
jgi:hypothetical protein